MNLSHVVKLSHRIWRVCRYNKTSMNVERHGKMATYYYKSDKLIIRHYNTGKFISLRGYLK